jgi:poly-gamma-glutamate synthesis protein (capsule biosynthesis protein)
MDYGKEGLAETIKVLDENGIFHLGAGFNVDEAKKPLIIEKNELRIAFLSFCETEFNMGSDDKAGCAPIELGSVCEAIQRARTEADLVIPLLHCGSEHYPLPSPRIKKQCRSLVECGASAVICHHTHTVEGYEVYQNIPIFYGLGNFIFGYRPKRRRSKQFWNRGLMIGIDFHKTGAVKFDVIPYFYDAGEIALKRLEGDRLKSFFDRLDLLNQIIEDDDKLERIWRQYSLRRYKSWYSPTLKKARLYFWRNKARRNMVLWHNRANESHNDVIMTALDALKKGKTAEDAEMTDLLDGLIGRQTKIMKIKRLIRAWI